MRALLFILLPALELYLLVKVGAVTGALNMVAWVFASAFLGIWAITSQGRGAMERARQDLAEGRIPQNVMLDGMLRFFAGVLLILPGLISDALGLLLLIPVARKLFISGFGSRLAARAQQGGGSARVIFFSSGFPGGSPRPDVFSDASSRATPGTSGSINDPRQATVIESTAIPINPEGKADSDKARD